MDADERREKMNGISELVIGCAFRVHNELGAGFLEKVYDNALVYELRKAGHEICQQHPIPVYYDQTVVGEYLADLLVDQSVVVELKAVKELDEIHLAQCLNYLKATNLSLCLLLNFAKPKLQIKRVVHNF